MYSDRMPPSASFDAARFDRERQKMQRRGWSWRRRTAAFVGRNSWRATKATTRVTIKHRSWLWPIIGSSGMFAAASALGLTADGWKTALVLCVLAGLVLGWRQWRAWQAAEAWLQRSLIVSWIVWAASSAWTTVAAGTGTHSAPVLGGLAQVTLPGAMAAPLPGLLLLATIGAEAWWLIHLHRRKTQQLVQLAEDQDEWLEKAIDRRVETWMTHISKDGGALPGSMLVAVDDLRDEDGEPNGKGWEALIQLPLDDAQNSESCVAATRRIAKVYGVPATQVVVEPPLDGLEDVARLLVLTGNPLMKARVFEHPTLDARTGECEIGIHADGSIAPWRLWRPGSGLCHGMVAGTTGSGKSGLLMNLCAEIRHSGLGILLLADPECGESVRDWQIGAHCFAGTIPRIRRMLQGAERIMHARKKRRSKETWIDEHGRRRHGRGEFTPTREEPGVYVLVDEAPDVLADPECRRIIASIGKKGRKHGVAVIIFVQIPSLSELGGELSVRSMLSSTNIVIFRTSDTLSAQMGVPMKLPIDPANLPEEFPDGSTTAGLGYRARSGGRVSPMRAAWQEDPYHWATTGDPAPIPAADYAAFADKQGNLLDQWRDLLHVDEEDEDDAAATIAENYGVQVPAKTNEKIVAFLARRAAKGERAVRTGVIANNLDLSKPATSMALKRMAAESAPVVQNVGHGMWGLAETAEVVDGELVGAAS